MSLVNEALKKARLEAARQDAARRGLPLPGAQAPARRRIAGPSLIQAGLVLLLVAVAALLFFAGRFTSSPAADAPDSQLAAVTRAPTSEAPAESGVREVATAVEDPIPARVQPAAAQTEPPKTQAPVARAGRPEAAAEPATASIPPPTPAEQRSADRASRVRVRTPLAAPAPAVPSAADAPPATGIRTEVRTLELPGSRRIELGGIAWSEDRPFALINGRVVGPGDTIESLTVVSIEQRAVELEGDAGHFLLRLK